MFPLFVSIWPQSGFWLSFAVPPRPSYIIVNPRVKKGEGPCLPWGLGSTHLSLFHSSPISACPGVQRLPSAFTGGRCAADSGRPEVSRSGGGGSGSCGRAEGRIPDCEVAAPAPGPAPPPARERGVAGRLPPQPSSPRPPSTLQRARTGAAAEARGGGAGARKGPAAAGQRPPSSRRGSAAAGVPQPLGGPASRSAARERTTRKQSGVRRGSASLFPLPCTSH